MRLIRPLQGRQRNFDRIVEILPTLLTASPSGIITAMAQTLFTSYSIRSLQGRDTDWDVIFGFHPTLLNQSLSGAGNFG